MYTWQLRKIQRDCTLDETKPAFAFNSVATLGDIDWRATYTYDEGHSPVRIFLNGGCELSFAGAVLESMGHAVYDTFVAGSSADPMDEFSLGNGENARQFDPQMIVLSSAQLAKGLLRTALNPRRPVSFDDQDRHLSMLVEALKKAVSSARRACPRAQILFVTNPIFDPTIFNAFEYANFPSCYSVKELQARFNAALFMIGREFAVEVIDANEIIARFGYTFDGGKRARIRFGEIAGGHPEVSGGEILAMTLLGYAQATLNTDNKVKCVVLDLDNTLWDGVIREVGIAKIKDSLRLKFIRAAYNLSLRGIVLAIVSKNDPEVGEWLREIFSAAPGFWNAVVATRVNWLPKSANISSIASELNIGLESIAFFDDQAYERAEVAENAKGIRVFTDADLLQAARFVPFVQAAPLSEDSFNRADLYKTERIRKEHQAPSFDKEQFEKFLMASNFVLRLEIAGADHVNRVFELFLRTNQQNATLQRVSRERILHQLTQKDSTIFCCYLEDRYGSYGMIGAVLARFESPGEAVLEEVAFSCRAMGKGIEPAFLRKIAAHVVERAERIRMKIMRSGKNGGMIDIIQRVGFQFVEDDVCVLTRGTISAVDEPWINWAALPTDSPCAAI